MGAAKIVGGILALAGGAFIVLQILGFLPLLISGDPEYTSCLLLNLALCGLAIAGSLAIVFGLITVYLTNSEASWPLSFFTSTLHWFTPPDHLFAGISIEALLILGGGITIVAGGSK
jgi:hypothetical protein